MNPIILADNRFLDGTPTATDTAAGYDVLNIRDLKSFTSWKAASSGTKYLTVPCSEPKWADTLAYAFGNLRAASALVSVEYSHDNSVWTEILAPFQFVSDRPRMVTFTRTRARYWRVKIVTASVAAQVGELMVGERIEFPYPPAAPFVPQDEGVEADTNRGKTGTLLGTVVRYRPITLSPRFQNVSREWVETYYVPFWEDWGSNLSPFFWAWDLYNCPWQVEFTKFQDSYRFAPDVSVKAYYDTLSLDLEAVRSTAARAGTLDWWFSEGLLLHAPLDDPGDPLKTSISYGALTFTRGSTATYLDPVTGLIKSAAINALRIEAAGALIEGARTNLLIYSRDMTDAAWAKTTMTAAKDQVGEDGAANSASSLLATGANATCLQALTQASNPFSGSISIKRLIGTGAVSITLDGGATWVAVTSSLSTSAWYRAKKENQTLANPSFGIRLATSGDKVAVDYAGVEQAAFASSRIPTTSATVTRSADNLSMGLAGNIDDTINGKGTVFAEVEIIGKSASQRGGYVYFLSAGASFSVLAHSSNDYFYNHNNDYLGVAITADTAYKIGKSWNGDTDTDRLAVNGTVGITLQAGSANNDPSTSILIGCYSTSYLFGHLKNLRIWSRALTDVEMQLLGA